VLTLDIVSGDNNVLENANETQFLNFDGAVPESSTGDDVFSKGTNSQLSISASPSPDKKNLTINATADPIYVDDAAIVFVTGLENATGKVYVDIGSVVYFGYINEGVASVIVYGVVENTTANVTYDGDENYNPASTNVTIIVYPFPKIDTNISIVVSDDYVSERKTVNIRFPGSYDIGGNITVILNNESRTFDMKDAETIAIMDYFYVLVRYANLTVGNYSVEAYYSGDDHYLPSNATGNFSIYPKENLTMNISASPVIEGQNVTIDVELVKDAIVANVTATVDGKNFTFNVVRPDVKIIIPGLAAGNYTVPVSYSGNFKYNPVSQDVNISVLPRPDVNIVADNVIKYYGGSERFVANIYDSNMNPIANKSVNITINGVTYTRTTNDNGTASLALRLKPGTYYVTTQLNDVSADSTVTILSTIESADLTKYYRNETQFTVQVFGTDGKAVGAGEKVTFNVHGVLYTRTTNESGIAKLNINLEPGQYIITTSYNNCNVSNNITVVPVLNASDLSMKYMDGSQFKATLLDGQGKPCAGQNITFNINGVFYDRLTDSNGVANLNIRLMVGEYIITSSYNGCNVANTITITS